MLAEILLAVALIGLLHTYFGYPALIFAKARLRPRPIAPCDWQPRVDFVVVVHNGAHEISTKLDNLLALDFPAQRRRIHIAFDGDVESAAIVHQRADPDLILHEFAQRRGKSACLADVIPLLDADVVVFTDVRQRIETGAVKALLRPLADSAVGAVSGELVFEQRDDNVAEPGATTAGIDFYWRYEKFVRRNESISGSVVGVTGALYAARRTLLPNVPAGLILDDLWIPLAIARTGARILFAPDAIAWDRIASDPAHEARRKRRTLAGNFQLLARDPGLLLPWRHPLGWRLWGHKWLRLLAPWLLLVALLANSVLAPRAAPYRWLLIAQIGFWLLATAGLAFPAASRLLPIRIAATFARMNLYALLGLIDFLRDRQSHLWTSAPVAGKPVP